MTFNVNAFNDSRANFASSNVLSSGGSSDISSVSNNEQLDAVEKLVHKQFYTAVEKECTKFSVEGENNAFKPKKKDKLKAIESFNVQETLSCVKINHSIAYAIVMKSVEPNQDRRSMKSGKS